jgi:hypothetical protein
MQTDILRGSPTFKLKLKRYKEWRSHSPRDYHLQFLCNRTHTKLLPSISKHTNSENAIISLPANGRFKVVMAVHTNITSLRDMMTCRDSSLLRYDTISTGKQWLIMESITVPSQSGSRGPRKWNVRGQKDRLRLKKM